jgi:hypothetical protein
MAFCCFPRLKCFKTKTKVRTDSLESNKPIRSSSSLGKLNSAGQTYKQESQILEKSLPEISKPLQQSRSLSHKSMIAVKRVDRFEPLQVNLEKKGNNNQMDSLSISRISNVSVLDNSGIGFLNEFNMIERAVFQDNGRVQKIHNSKKFFKEFVMKKRDAPPMFLRNPCFGSSGMRGDNE